LTFHQLRKVKQSNEILKRGRMYNEDMVS